jgi:hypothetical protein
MTQYPVLATILASIVLALPAIIHATEPSQSGSPPIRCESTSRKKPVPPKQLQAIVESHGQWLEHREKLEYQRADLCQAVAPPETRRGQSGTGTNGRDRPPAGESISK